MAVSKCQMVFVVLTFLWTFNRGDAEDCFLTESCILPCTFQPGDEVVLHWIQMPTGDTVHSYYHNQDQLAHQKERYRGRTSLFKGQMSRGNASLRLTRVEFQDRGRYRCYTSTISGNKESFVDLDVEAPVRKVDIQQVENRITCSSEGIYPGPELTWSTNPPSTLNLQDKPTVHQTEQQLYNINSSLIVSDSVTDLVYSCTVSTRRNSRRATLSKTSSISGCDTETTIHCTSSNTPLTNLIWRFNHSQIILNQTKNDVPYTVTGEWRQLVKDVSESGSLILQELSSNQEGIYTCELSTAEGTQVTNTVLKIMKGYIQATDLPSDSWRLYLQPEKNNADCSTSPNAAGIAVGVVVPILVLAVIAVVFVFYIYKKRKDGKSHTEPSDNRAGEPSNGRYAESSEMSPLKSVSENGAGQG